MSGFLANLVDYYQGQMQRHRNRAFLRAAMGACALVAAAGGSVSLRERVRLDQVLDTLDALKVFDPHEGVALFDEFVGALQDSEDEGLRLIHEAIDNEVAEEPEKAGLLVRLCQAVSETSEGIPEAEQRRIEALCEHLGLDREHCPERP
jgi:tellurite resistance protein TerB